MNTWVTLQTKSLLEFVREQIPWENIRAPSHWRETAKSTFTFLNSKACSSDLETKFRLGVRMFRKKAFDEIYRPAKEVMLNVYYTYLKDFGQRQSHSSLKGARVRQYELHTTGCNNMAEQCFGGKMHFMTELAVIFLRRGSLNAICNECTEHACTHEAYVFPRNSWTFHDRIIPD